MLGYESITFETIKERWEQGYIRIDQLKKFVELGVITAEQYKELTGDDYIAAASE